APPPSLRSFPTRRSSDLGAVAARALPVEELHRHAAERQEIVREPRALHRYERLAVQALRQRSIARQACHPARRAGVRPEPVRLLGHTVTALGELARRKAEPAARRDYDESLLLDAEPIAVLGRR